MAIVAVTSSAAHAGRSAFGWLDNTDLLVDRAVELQMRVTEREDLGDTRIRETAFVTAAQIGIADHFEVTLPIEMVHASAVGIEPAFALRRYGVELRYRFVEPEPRPAWSPVVRFAALRDVVQRDLIHLELDGTVAFEHGRLLAAAGVGVTSVVNRGGLRLVARPGAGASIAVSGGLRLGAELHAELPRDSGETGWVVAGPSIAWTHGRFWLAATYGIGLSNIHRAPRAAWGIAF